MKKYNFKWESIHWGLNTHLLEMEGAAAHLTPSPIGMCQGVRGQVLAVCVYYS